MLHAASNSASSQPKYDVVISGMGPAGLACAWIAAKQNKSVLIITDRAPPFLRPQRLFLDINSRLLLYQMLADVEGANEEDKKFINKLKKRFSIETKEIERFIKRRLDEFGVQVTSLFQAELDHVKLDEGKAVVRDIKGEKAPLEVRFTHLIGADGIGRHALGKVNEHLSEDEKIHVTEESMHLIMHFYHASVYVTLKNSDDTPLNLPNTEYITTVLSERNFSEDASARHLGKNEDNEDARWSKSTLSLIENGALGYIWLDRESYQKYEGKQIKCSLVFEIPQELYQLQDEKIRHMEILNRAKRMIITALHDKDVDTNHLEIDIVKNSKKYGIAKDKLKLMPFEVAIEVADKAAISSNNNYFILVSDAYRNPNYQLGHGANNGFSHAKNFGEVLAGKKSLKEYNEDCESLSLTADEHAFFFDKKQTPILAEKYAKKTLKETTKKIDEIEQERIHKPTINNKI
jgi:hypothetical protein